MGTSQLENVTRNSSVSENSDVNELMAHHYPPKRDVSEPLSSSASSLTPVEATDSLLPSLESVTVTDEPSASVNKRPESDPPANPQATPESQIPVNSVDESALASEQSKRVVITANDSLPLGKKSEATPSPPATGTSNPDEKGKLKTKSSHGWPSIPPFSTKPSLKSDVAEYTYWSDLSSRDKYTYHKQFLLLYLSEGRKCLPYVRRFLLLLFRTSPWRMALLVALNTINGILPAVSLRTRGDFFSMVSLSSDLGIDSSCNKA
jgi:hypothetical protein